MSQKKKKLHVRESNPGRLRDRQKCYQLHQRGPQPAPNEVRTRDLTLTKRMLCQLSYKGGSGSRFWVGAATASQTRGLRIRRSYLRSALRKQKKPVLIGAPTPMIVYDHTTVKIPDLV